MVRFCSSAAHLLLTVASMALLRPANSIRIIIINGAFHHHRLRPPDVIRDSFSSPKKKKNFVSISVRSVSDDSHVEHVTESMRVDSLEQMEKLTDRYRTEDGSPPFLLLSKREDVSSYVDANVDAFLFDCDGVLYRGKDASPDASEALRRLYEGGKTCLYVTNNAGSNRQQLRDKLVRVMGCDEIAVEQIISSSYACSRYLKKSIPRGARGRVHVIGSRGLCDELQSNGFHLTGGPALSSDDGDERNQQPRPSMSREELAAYEFPEHPVDAVVVGLDTEFNYRKLCIANVLLQRNPRAILVSTNQDAFDLVGADGRHLPGNGSLVKALECCSERIAVNVGKPSHVLAEIICDEYQLDPARTMMVGDRLDTDIVFGNRNGMISALVMTGVTTAESLEQFEWTNEDSNSRQLIPKVIFPFMGMLA